LLRPPSDSDVNSYVDNLIEALLRREETCADVTQKFSEVFKTVSMSPSVKEKTACRLVCKKMVHNALSVRKGHVGKILKTLRKINAT